MRTEAKLLALACALAMAACGDDTEDPVEGVGVLLDICGALVDRGHAERCGTADDPCGEAAGPGCIQVGGVDEVVAPGDEIDARTQDLPRDLAALFELIDFLPPEAAAAITPTGTITWGDPAKEGEPYLEIDQEGGEYRIDSGQRPSAIDPEDETLDESHYEQDVQRYFSPLGVAPGQASITVNALMASSHDQDGNPTSMLISRVAYVYRAVNQVRVRPDRLIFGFSPDDGRLLHITGDWSPVDFANSQFSLTRTSTSALVKDLIALLDSKGRTPDEIGYLGLVYDLREGATGQTLDLVLEIGVDRSIFDMDI